MQSPDIIVDKSATNSLNLTMQWSLIFDFHGDQQFYLRELQAMNFLKHSFFDFGVNHKILWLYKYLRAYVPNLS